MHRRVLEIMVSTEPRERTTDEGVLVLPIRTFFERLWGDELIGR